MELIVDYNYNECGATTKDATQLGFLQDVYYFLVDLYYYYFFHDIYNYFNHLVKLFTMEYNFREVLTTNLSFSRGGLLFFKKKRCTWDYNLGRKKRCTRDKNLGRCLQYAFLFQEVDF